MYYVYILQSYQDQSYYIGYTANIERRLEKHNQGHSFYSRRKAPWKLILTEIFDDKTAAIKREKEIKSWKSGNKFKNLIINNRSDESVV